MVFGIVPTSYQSQKGVSICSMQMVTKSFRWCPPLVFGHNSLHRVMLSRSILVEKVSGFSVPCTVEEVETDTLYKVRFKTDVIRWVTKHPIKGRDDTTNNLPLCVYGLIGWQIFKREDGFVIIRRSALTPQYRGCAAAQKNTNIKIRAEQRRWLRCYWRGKSTRKQNVVVASFLMVCSS